MIIASVLSKKKLSETLFFYRGYGETALIFALANIMTEKGELFVDDYLRAGITVNVCLTGKSEEDLVVHRRRTTILTNAGFILRQRLKTEAALLVGNENRQELAKNRKEERATQKSHRDAAKIIKDAAKEAKRVNSNLPIVRV